MSVDLAYIENRFLIFDAASLAGGDRPSYWEVLLLQCKYRSFTVGTTQVGECSACPSNAAAANSATNTDAWADGSNATADATTANAANANSNAIQQPGSRTRRACSPASLTRRARPRRRSLLFSFLLSPHPNPTHYDPCSSNDTILKFDQHPLRPPYDPLRPTSLKKTVLNVIITFIM